MSSSSLKYKSTRILTNALIPFGYQLTTIRGQPPSENPTICWQNQKQSPSQIHHTSYCRLIEAKSLSLQVCSNASSNHSFAFPSELLLIHLSACDLCISFLWSLALWVHQDEILGFFFSFWLRISYSKKDKWHGKGVAVKTSWCQQGCHPSGRPRLSSGHVVWTFVPNSLLHFLLLAVLSTYFKVGISKYICWQIGSWVQHVDPNHICLCAMTISLKLQEPTRIIISIRRRRRRPKNL